MAKALNAETILLHIVSHPAYYTGIYTQELQVEVSPDVRKSTQGFLDKLKIHLGDDSIQTIVKGGIDVAITILNTANELNVDFIVLGSHSHNWLENIILLGSQVEELLNKTTIPLYIIPTKKQKI